MTNITKNIIRKLQKDESGSLMVYVAAMLPVFIICLMFTIDASKALASKGKVGYVQDSVAVAYSSVSDSHLQTNGNGISREDYAMRFATLNTDDGSFLSTNYAFNLSSSESNVEISTTVLDDRNTFFAGAAGNSNIKLGTGASSIVSKTYSTNTEEQQTLLALVLDGSGSMSGTKLTALRSSVSNLVDSTLANNSDGDFWISQIVYDSGGDGIKYNRNFSNNYLTVKNWASDIRASGGTCGACGMNAAGARTAGKIQSDSKFASYKKQIVFMTDGQMTHGNLSSSCTTLKNAGYEVYGIAFGSGANKSTIRSCANDGNFYEASDEQDLIDVFRAITTRIINTRIVQ